MADVSQGWVSNFAYELATGEHDLLNDDLKIALYPDTKDLSYATTTAYVTSGEITGSGYTAGGVAVTMSLDHRSGLVAVLFDDAVFDNVDLEPRSGILYNSSQENKAIAVIDFMAARRAASAI